MNKPSPVGSRSDGLWSWYCCGVRGFCGYGVKFCGVGVAQSGVIPAVTFPYKLIVIVIAWIGRREEKIIRPKKQMVYWYACRILRHRIDKSRPALLHSRKEKDSTGEIVAKRMRAHADVKKVEPWGNRRAAMVRGSRDKGLSPLSRKAVSPKRGMRGQG